MANADTKTTDWDLWVQNMKNNQSKGSARLAVYMVSHSLRIVHEFHLVGTITDNSLIDVNYDAYATSVNVNSGNPISLRSLRGQRAFVVQYSQKLSFGATVGRGLNLYLSASLDPASSPDYSITGQWLLRKVVAYTDLFRV